jgi:hypothetical protein
MATATAVATVTATATTTATALPVTGEPSVPLAPTVLLGVAALGLGLYMRMRQVSAR